MKTHSQIMKRKIDLKFVFILTMALVVNKTYSQDKTLNKFGKGIQITAADSSFSMKFSARIQSLFVAEVLMTDSVDWKDLSTSMMIRRARLKFDGFAYSPKVQYKIELGLSNRDIGSPVPQGSNASNVVFDAYVEWNFYKNFSILVGQTKLPGNRERVISSQAMQLVDRSLLNARYNIDRDMGMHLKHHFKIGTFAVQEVFAITQGEGRNITGGNIGGYDYTGRVELYPFGAFKSKGDYVGSDISREEKPKLALGFTFDNNDRAAKQNGQLGAFMAEQRTLKTIFADMMFKYKGFSVMGEYCNKQSVRTPVVSYDATGNPSKSFYTGTGMNFQMGMLMKKNWEIAARYTMVTPEEVTGFEAETQYTLGFSRYVVGHNLKFQTDISYLEVENVNDPELMFRMQVELAF